MLTPDKPMNHHVDHNEIDHRFARGRERFVVLAHSTIPTDPREGALHDPAFRQHREADDRIAAFNNRQHPAAERLGPFDQLARVAAVGPDCFQSRVHTAKFLEHELRPVAVLHIRRVHHDGQNQPQHIDNDVPLTAVDLLARIVATRPPFSVVLALWLSKIAAEGVGLRPALIRTDSRR